MSPHRFEHAGSVYEVQFERTPDGWLARIRCDDEDHAQAIGFPDGSGYDPGDVRGSLIAGCEAIVAAQSTTPPTRH